MDQHEIKEAVRDFLDLLETGSDSEADNERRLTASLDRLALAQSYVTYTFDETDHPDPPTQSYDDLRALVASRFPNYGYYNLAVPIHKDIGEADCSVNDAIDDLADIARDLYDVEWCWSNTSADDALWRFQNRFNFHWRRHLRGLQLYFDALELDRDLSD